MTNEEQLRDMCKGAPYATLEDAEEWLVRNLHQAELNWLTAQIEREECYRDCVIEVAKEKQDRLPDTPSGNLGASIIFADDLPHILDIALTRLTPLIERKKEVEDNKAI